MRNIDISLWIKTCVLIILTGIIKCSESDYFDVQSKPFYIFPDDARWAEMRCQEIAQKNNKLKKLWKNYEFPDDNITHCYIKCYLKRLGLINLITRGLDHDKLYQLWDNVESETTDVCLEEIDLTKELDDRCVSYYEKWIHLRQKCADFIKNAFYEYGPTYQYPRKFQLPTKPLGMGAIEFCESMDNEESNDVVEITDAPGKSIVHEAQLACIFKRFFYFDAYGRLDNTEIIRSFQDAFILNETSEFLIKNCIHHANAKYLDYENADRDMAHELNRCLVERFDKQFRDVMDQRNKLTKSI